MAHASDYSEIYVTPGSTPSGISAEEICACLGEDTFDIGALCTSDKIKLMARYKPERRAIHGYLTDTMRATGNKYGIVCTGYTSATSLRQGAGIYYERPNANYRYLDFGSYDGDPAVPYARGYYNGAPSVPAVCVNKGTVSGNVIDENESAKIAFYAAMNDGYYKWKAINETNGFDSASLIPAGKTEAYFSSHCIGIEDILLTDLTTYEAYFGVALFQSSTLKYFVKCEHPLTHASQADNYNHIIPLVGEHGLIADSNGTGGGTYVVDGADLAQGGGSSGGSSSQASNSVAYGVYNAVPCLYYQGKYYRLHANGTYTNSFTLNLGGAEMYEVSYLMGAFSSSGPYSNSLTDTGGASQHNTLYVKVRFQDVSYGKQTKIAAANLSRIHLEGYIWGTVDGASLSRRFDIHLSGSYDITIPANGYKELIFSIENIYEAAGQSSQYHSSASIHVSGTTGARDSIMLKYGNLVIPPDGLQVIDITLS